MLPASKNCYLGSLQTDTYLPSLIFKASCLILGPVKGGANEHSSYIRQPSDHISDFLLYLPPFITS